MGARPFKIIHETKIKQLDDHGLNMHSVYVKKAYRLDPKRYEFWTLSDAIDRYEKLFEAKRTTKPTLFDWLESLD
jgi:hypothetical protein